MFSTFSGSLAVRFHRRLAECYANGHNTDIKIICKGREFPAIKFVLCVQSDVFAKMFAGDFKVSIRILGRLEGQEDSNLRILQESRDGVAELKDEDPETIEKLLDFCHTLGYKLAPESKDSLGPITRHMRIYIAGDKYMIPELRDMAIKNIRAACLAGWRKPVFAEAIEEAYLQTDYPIFHDIVLAVAVAAYDAYVANREEYKAFWEATLEVPGFARDMLLKLPGSRSTFANRRYICPTCSEALNLCLAPDATYEHSCNKKPFTLPGTRTLTQQMCQDLFINVNGDLVGGLSLGFQIDEMPKPSKALKPLFGKIEGRNVFGISPK